MLFCTMPNNPEIPRLEAPQLVVMDLLDSGAMTTDQIAAIGPDIIVNHVTDLAQVWKFPARPDIALEDEISRILQRH